MQIHNKKIAIFDNSYIALPDDFYQHINPVPVKSPKLIIFNKNLGKNIGIDTNQSEECYAQLFSGNIILIIQILCFQSYNFILDGWMEISVL